MCGQGSDSSGNTKSKSKAQSKASADKSRGRPKLDFAAQLEEEAAAFRAAKESDPLWFQKEAGTKLKALESLESQMRNRIKNTREPVECLALQKHAKKLGAIMGIVGAGIDHGLRQSS